MTLDKYRDSLHNNTLNDNDANFRKMLIEISESYDALTGNIDLNAAGDRVSDNYDFWIVTKDNSTQHYEWHRENNAHVFAESPNH
jgi:ABC-type branched-subunit amino acid transport system substrate-binding protein